MKKYLILTAFLTVTYAVQAQVDTLGKGAREPTYYYWDTNWWDHYYLHYPGGGSTWWIAGGVRTHEICRAEVARYCYTDTSLRVLGIAAAIGIYYDHLGGPFHPAYVEDSILFERIVPEYLRLYEVDSLNDNMILLAQSQWTNKMQPRYKIATGWHYQNAFTIYDNLYELFFDSAITVRDSFYVAMTGNNNSYHVRDQANVFVAATHTNPHKGWAPNPNHFRRKLHYIDGCANVDYAFGITDTNWHTLAKWYYEWVTDPDTVYQKAPDLDQFIYLFPIIDTSRVIPPPACHTPGGLTKVFANGGTVTLMWNGSPHTDHWQLSLCADGCEPEDGDITECGVTVATLQGLDTARWYTARVRSVCVHNDSAYYSDWSDSLRFYMPGGNGGGTDPTGIETVADRYTYLMPNPAGETVTVASSFRIGEVELYDLNGKLLARQKVDGLQTALDISALAAGTYIVRVTTNNGTAYKKLVKN